MPSKQQIKRQKRQQRHQEEIDKQVVAKKVLPEVQKEVKQVVAPKQAVNIHAENNNGILCSNLTNADMNVVLNPLGYLEDIHMDSFFVLIRAISQFVPQPTYYIQAPNRIQPVQQGSKHVQILFQRPADIRGIGHWTTAYYNGTTVTIYDSMNSRSIHPDANTYLQHLFPFRPQIRFAQVQQQTNTYDCGLFSIAFCTSILFNRNPEHETYDIARLRTHAAEIFRSGQITLFPVIQQQKWHQKYLKRKSQETDSDRKLRFMKVRSQEADADRELRLNKLKRNFQNYVTKLTNVQKQMRLKRDNDTKKQKIADKKAIVLNVARRTYKLADKCLVHNIEQHSLGEMNVICSTCKSRNFAFEKPADGKFNHCCRKGKLIPDQLGDYPEYLKHLMTGNDSDCKNFRENIRKYNSALAFASMGANIAPPPGQGPYTFRIHGQIYHSTTSLYPANGETEKYAQLYIVDTTDALAKRLNVENNKKCKPDIMKKLDLIIREINPYCAAFMMLKEVEDVEIAKARQNNQVVPIVQLWIVNDRSKDKRRYNVPTSNEVAVVFTSNDGEPPCQRDIAIHPRGKNSIRINQYSENCDPMCYPVLFPRGESGWGIHRRQVDGKKKQTPLQFYMNRLADRGQFNPCLQAGKLTQQYVVDAYVKVESERLTYIRLNQPTLRVELYSGLMDHINNLANLEGAKPGTMVILPSTFQGGSRFMQKLYQDSMAIVREFGKPDLFITVTCNPKWREIAEQLREGQTASDRPDIVVRVFYGKIKAMLHEFLHEDIFGKVVAYMYVIEFQKRGLPHMHLLLTLDEASKIRNKDDIDAIVSAEIPDEVTEPELYRIVQSHMIHGPCGVLNKNSPCMADNKCSKKFPKDFRNETQENANGYPLYKRRDNNAKMYILWPNGTTKYTIDNRWIIPYNPYLMKKYRTHINVEVCASVKSIKYICKYFCKGHDCASVKLGQVDRSKTLQWDEISGYLNTRYVSPPECFWRLLEYPLHDKSHTIYELAVHLQYQQSVVFAPGQVQQAIDRAAKRNTTLTAWFLLNQTDANARQYRYMDIPKHYVFTSDNTWKVRQRVTKPPIGRMISVSPKDIERFHLRLLLVHATGATSFETLRTVDGTVHDTYLAAARAKGLLANNDECDVCMQEAVLDKFPKQLRELFAYLISFHTSVDAVALWDKFQDYLMEDYLQNNPRQTAQNKCLQHIQDILIMQRLQLKDFGLPEPGQTDDVDDVNEQIDMAAEKLEGEKNVALFNKEQSEILRFILNAIRVRNVPVYMATLN